MLQPTSTPRQRADLTFRHNQTRGRHGWLRLTPAYSLALVDELLTKASKEAFVLDPFCGSATTPLCATQRGFPALGLEINPFLAWFCQVKLDIYQHENLVEAEAGAQLCLRQTEKRSITPAPAPAIHNIERWWSRQALDFLTSLKGALDRAHLSQPARNLLLVAFCRTLMALSNAAFNHQSLSFKTKGASLLDHCSRDALFLQRFQSDVSFVLEGAQENPLAQGRVIEADSRDVARAVSQPVNTIITSPPYPNRMSYIRELRPYMYWLGHLSTGREAGELDWRSIGGTWGVATSRLSTWKKDRGLALPVGLEVLMDQIAHQDNANGLLLAQYICKYFQDMLLHLQSLRSILCRKASIHYIVGNSKFYNTLVPVERLFASLMEECGFIDTQVDTIRKRNSKKELFEFRVSATWPGHS